MLDRARAQLEEILTALQSDVAAGTPVIGLEPSCVSVFRDEMPNLLGRNDAAAKLRGQTFLLSEFLVQKAGYRPPQLRRKALIIADGFSCFQQIEQLTGRKALHIAEVVQMAIRGQRNR